MMASIHIASMSGWVCAGNPSSKPCRPALINLGVAARYTVIMSSLEHVHLLPGQKKAAGGIAPRTSVAVSFGSPAGESGVGRLDLNDILIRHPQASFLMRIAGHSMREAGIDDGDLALVDRAITAAHGHVVIAAVGDEFVCRRLHRLGGELRLQAADRKCADLIADEGEEFQVWGVVINVIKSLPV